MLTFIHFFQDLYSHYFCDHKYVRMVKWGKHARKLRILVWKHSTSTSSKPFAISRRYKKRQQCGETSITHDYFQNQNHEQMNSTQKHSNKMSKKNEEKNSRPYRGDLSRLLKIKTHRKEKFTSEVDKKSKKQQQKMKNKKQKLFEEKQKQSVCSLFLLEIGSLSFYPVYCLRKTMRTNIASQFLIFMHWWDEGVIEIQSGEL